MVWFGEALPEQAPGLGGGAGVRSVPVGWDVPPGGAARLPWLAAARGATVGVINTTMEGQRSGERIHHLIGAAATVLPGLVRAAWPEAPG